MPNWQSSNSKLVCHSKMSYNKEKEKFVCEMKMTYNDQKWLVEQYLRDHADEIIPFKGLNPEWSRRYHSTDPYWNLHSIQWTTEHGLLAKYSDQFFNLFIEMKWGIDNTHQVKPKNVWIKELEQKGKMNPERMKKYT